MADLAAARERPSRYGKDLAYFVGVVPRYRHMQHLSETEQYIAAVKDPKLELSAVSLEQRGYDGGSLGD